MSKASTDAAIDSVENSIGRLERKIRNGKANGIEGADLQRLYIRRQDLQIRQFKREMARITKLPKATP